jgi:Domain of unknown function (DUF6379)
MSMVEGMVAPDALSARDGRLALAIRLPWYRSLPLSCLESVEVTVDGEPAAVCRVRVPGFTGPLQDASSSEAVWDLRDPLDLTLDADARPGPHTLEVAVAVRIPYIQQAPGVPLVQRAVRRTEATVR